MGWEETRKLTERLHVVKDVLQAAFPRWRLGSSYSGWSEALRACSLQLVPAISQRLRRRMQVMAGKYWTREGWLAFAADGSRVECPRTEANEKGLGCAGKNRTRPQLMLTTLYHMGTGLPWEFRVGPGIESERRQLDKMVGCLPKNALLVTDAGFASYELCSTLIGSRRHFLLRVGSNVHLLSELGCSYEIDGETVYLWPEKQQHNGLPPLVLRLIVLGKGDQRVYLITDVLDHQQLSDKQAGILFSMRWGVEVFFRSYKRTMDKHKMASRTPPTCVAELVWTMLGLWMIGLLSVQRIVNSGTDPLAWSVAASRDCMRRVLRGVLAAGRPRTPLNTQLAHALKDRYVRTRSKKARNWPHKKRERPPGPPNMRPATLAEIQCAQRLATTKHAA